MILSPVANLMHHPLPGQRDNGTSSTSFQGPGQPVEIWDGTLNGTGF